MFPNATYRCEIRDRAHFVGPDLGATKKLRPIEDRLEPWEASATLFSGINSMSAPGHTPQAARSSSFRQAPSARCCWVTRSHCPVELLEDEWSGMGDVDPELAQRTRIALARELEGVDTPVQRHTSRGCSSAA